MTNPNARPPGPVDADPRGPAIGYLLVLEDSRHGFTGGLLVVCGRGRPLEFHCTEPVRPSRAEQILFGASLRPHLCGERIGGALLAKTQTPIAVLVCGDADSSIAGRAAGLRTVVADSLGGSDWEDAALARLADWIDPSEPLTRVADAIREAQRLGVGGAGHKHDGPSGVTDVAA